ncbi:alpha-N-acetylgalactosaminide alpha-2,6-sialyltransferase 5-like [Lethenteron reissneri]|uniref:alpha-N-acetylgalactosaminide alpha-2,6-sialyltransferase 5-like n=1 Tax=Lethenteron reissneri TaxID=7753 RepID=UPI002AB6C70B|nr:alpha-N-acetylgalactosaminide alpha-2,6-sialyltransferase 5-like [Lethenteron reissneri]
MQSETLDFDKQSGAMNLTGVPLLLCVAACGMVAALLLYGSLLLQEDLMAVGGHPGGPLSRPASPHGERGMDPRGVYILPGYASIHGQQPLRMRCGDCALITSSGHLLGAGLGPAVDSTECVIRMNDAPTRGYEGDVGSRTTLRVVAHSSVAHLVKHHGHLLWPGNATHPGAVVVFWGPSDRMRPGGKGPTFGLLRRLARAVPRLRAHIVTPRKMRTFDELFRHETGKDRKSSQSWLSTGWFTMGISLDVCDRLHVYGMVPPSYCKSPAHRRVPYHYYEPAGADECSMYIWHERGRRGSHHRFLTEKRVFGRWARAYNITFSHPAWHE